MMNRYIHTDNNTIYHKQRRMIPIQIVNTGNVYKHQKSSLLQHNHETLINIYFYV